MSIPKKQKMWKLEIYKSENRCSLSMEKNLTSLKQVEVVVLVIQNALALFLVSSKWWHIVNIWNHISILIIKIKEMNQAGTYEERFNYNRISHGIQQQWKNLQPLQTWKPNANSKRSNMSASRFPDTLNPAGSLGNCSVYLIEEIAPLTWDYE